VLGLLYLFFFMIKHAKPPYTIDQSINRKWINYLTQSGSF
jgi:hypothetical protein